MFPRKSGHTAYHIMHSPRKGNMYYHIIILYTSDFIYHKSQLQAHPKLNAHSSWALYNLLKAQMSLNTPFGDHFFHLSVQF